MATLGLPVKIIEVKHDAEGLTIKMTQELADLVKEAQPGSQPSDSIETGHWCYRMPFPGVRYYGYEE